MISPDLDENKKEPIYEQLYRYIKTEIRMGRLKSREKLPSKRSLARHLNISVNTAASAYEALLDEGYIYSEERRGYFVSDIENLFNPSMDFPKQEIEIKEKEKISCIYSLKINGIDTETFPRYTFRKLAQEVIEDENSTWLEERDPQGLYALRESIRNYIYHSRGVKTDSRNIIISSGSEYLMQILLYILPEDSVFAVENPGYKTLSGIFDINGIKYRPVDTDEKGMKDRDLEESGADIALITPSHQFPKGGIMTVERRLKILKWAEKSPKRYIIEDDYDSEFKYYGRPIPALKSLDRLDNVIYMGNFSKSISPLLRLSYMVLPDELLKIYYEKMPFINCPVSNLVQLVTAGFIDGGYFERHLNRMKKLYNDRREKAVRVFEGEEGIRVSDAKAGLHFIIEDRLAHEKTVTEELRKKSIYIESLSEYYFREKKKSGARFIIGFGNLREEDMEYVLEEVIEALKKSRKKPAQI